MNNPPAADSRIVLYGHAGCPMVPPVITMLKTASVDYHYIDIHQDSEAAARVRAINQGNESVPTLIFPDGSTLTEPSGSVLRLKLESIGYRVPLAGRLAMSRLLPVAVVALVIVILTLLHVF